MVWKGPVFLSPVLSDGFNTLLSVEKRTFFHLQATRASHPADNYNGSGKSKTKESEQAKTKI